MKQHHTPDISPQEYVNLIRKRFREAGDPAVAEGQIKYMRYKYEYYGLKAPDWTAILKELFRIHGTYDTRQLKTFARLCSKEPCHEMYYAGLYMTEKQIRKQPADFIDFLEEAIIKGAWWDTVDWVGKLVGIHFLRYPELQRQYCFKWISGDNIWLQRIAIIHQLLYKEKTDEALLFEMIAHRKTSGEFFVQKGAGWALRQYARIKPKAVVRFLNQHPELSPLTRREALKHVK